jgi:hypothetical protein
VPPPPHLTSCNIWNPCTVDLLSLNKMCLVKEPASYEASLHTLSSSLQFACASSHTFSWALDTTARRKYINFQYYVETFVYFRKEGTGGCYHSYMVFFAQPGFPNQYSYELRDGRPRNWISIPGRAKWFFSPRFFWFFWHRLWGPSSLIYNEYEGLFPWR